MVTGGFTKEEGEKRLEEHGNMVEVLVYLINSSWITDIL